MTSLIFGNELFIQHHLAIAMIKTQVRSQQDYKLSNSFKNVATHYINLSGFKSLNDEKTGETVKEEVYVNGLCKIDLTGLELDSNSDKRFNKDIVGWLKCKVSRFSFSDSEKAKPELIFDYDFYGNLNDCVQNSWVKISDLHNFFVNSLISIDEKVFL
jgi:hypothetical protein